MPDLDLLTEIHTDVRYIKYSLETHISEDKKIQQDYLKPLWETHQRRLGARAAMAAIYTMLSAGAALAVEWLRK